LQKIGFIKKSYKRKITAIKNYEIEKSGVDAMVEKKVFGDGIVIVKPDKGKKIVLDFDSVRGEAS
jgi:hypothetical protein